MALYIQGVWLGSIHVLKSSSSIVCMIRLTGISTVVEKSVEEMAILLGFFKGWLNKVPNRSELASHKHHHHKQLGLDSTDE